MNTPPATGRELLGWIGRQPDRDRLFERAERLGADRLYPATIVRWDADQVADVFHDLTQKPARGESRWGGPAGTGQVAAGPPDGPAERG